MIKSTTLITNIKNLYILILIIGLLIALWIGGLYFLLWAYTTLWDKKYFLLLTPVFLIIAGLMGIGIYFALFFIVFAISGILNKILTLVRKRA